MNHHFKNHYHFKEHNKKITFSIFLTNEIIDTPTQFSEELKNIIVNISICSWTYDHWSS